MMQGIKVEKPGYFIQIFGEQLTFLGIIHLSVGGKP